MPVAIRVGLPAIAQVTMYLGSAGDPVGVFQADLTAFVVVTAVAAFGLRADRRSAFVIGLSACVTALVHIGLQGDAGGAHWVAWLVLATGFAASGIAAVGRVVGVDRVAAGAVASGVLWVAMTGLFWADPVGDRLPGARQREFKQAVLHVDLATACAYDAVRFDRMHEDRIYSTVPLAATLIGRPSAGDTGAVWLGVGWLAWFAAWALGARRRFRSPDRVHA